MCPPGHIFLADTISSDSGTIMLHCVLLVTYIEMCKILYTTTKEMWLFDSMANTYPNCVSLFQDWLTAKTGVMWKDVYASSEVSIT